MSVSSMGTTGSPSAERGDVADVRGQGCVHPEQALEVRRHVLSKDSARNTADLFAVLADPTRLQVLSALAHASTGELCVHDLAAGLGRDDTTISHQLRVLRNQRIVAMRKEGRVVYYRLVDKHIRQLLSVGLSHAQESMVSSGQATQVVKEELV